MNIPREFRCLFAHCEECEAFDPVRLENVSWDGSLDFVCKNQDICEKAFKAYHEHYRVKNPDWRSEK